MNRRLPLILVAGVLVLCLVGVILAGISAGSGFGAVAYTVGDTKVSQQSVNDDLKALADNNKFAITALAPEFRTTDGAVNSSGAADWLTVEIFRQVGSDALAKRHQKISDGDRNTALANVVSQAGPSFRTLLRKLPVGLQRRLLDVLALQSRVKTAAFKGVHITVDPKYGFWNAKRFAVCPPTGCPKASSTTGG
jgi:hypothetical protein